MKKMSEGVLKKIGQNRYTCQVPRGYPSLPYILLYRGYTNTRTAEELLRQNQYCKDWTIPMGFGKSEHWHTVHEATMIQSGYCQVQVGGDNGPTLSLQQGDILFLPALTPHRGIPNSDHSGTRSSGFYHANLQSQENTLWDWKEGEPSTANEKYVTSNLPPPTDPITGEEMKSVIQQDEKS